MESLATFIQAQVCQLPKSYKVTNVDKSDPSLKLGDRFTLQVPYCNDFLSWEVLFSKNEAAPADFVFPSYFCDYRDVGEYISFHQTVLSLRNHYKKHQEKLISIWPDEFVLFQYETVKGMKDAEFHIVKDTVRMLIPIQEGMKLYIVFNPTVSHKEIIYYRNFEVKTTLPAWRKETCLLDYIIQIQETIEREMCSLANVLKIRKEYFSSLCQTFGNPIDGDKTTVSFRLDQGFVFISFANFPKDAPLVHLQSTLNLDKLGSPIRYKVENIPYGVSWSADEKVKKIATRIQESRGEFMEMCMKEQMKETVKETNKED